MSLSLSEALKGWTPEDLGNLCSLLDIQTFSTQDQILDRIKWLYHSKARASAISSTRNIGSMLRSKLSQSQHKTIARDKLRKIPSYDSLIIGACKYLKVFEKNASIAEYELFISHAIIISAIQRMKPRERQKVFEQQIDASQMSRKARIKGAGLGGPSTTFALLGVAQASGFGVYLASTTALGFLTHAVGVTLPFAVYTGMTSTIAFLIGPVGWLTAGLWGGLENHTAEMEADHSGSCIHDRNQ